MKLNKLGIKTVTHLTSFPIKIRQIFSLCILTIMTGNINLLYSQCSGNLILNDNEDLDSFKTENSFCSYFRGKIIISGEFNALNQFFEVFDTIDFVEINRSQIEDFIVPRGKLIYKYSVYENSRLSTLILRNNSNRGGGQIDIQKNPRLTELGLEFKSVFIFNIQTDTLVNIDIERDGAIYHYASTGNVVYSGKKIKLTYQYDLFKNDSLFNFSKILQHFILDSIANIRLFDFKKFDCEGVADIKQINSLRMTNINLLSLKGFEGSRQRIKYLYIKKCPSLQNFAPMADTEAKSITLIQNNGLNSLGGLPVSNQMEGLSLIENINLEDISRLEEVDSFVDDFIDFPDRVWIKDNPKISFCSYPAICDLIVNLGQPYVNLTGNTLDCFDNAVAKDACITSTGEIVSKIETWVTIKGNDVLVESDQLSEANLYDVTGKWVKSWHYLGKGVLLDVSFLTRGLYIIHLKSEAGQRMVAKFIRW